MPSTSILTLNPKALAYSTMEELPIELISEILVRLPAKSLFLCKCVCKPWNCLIKNPKFIKSHLNQTLNSDFAHRLLVSIKPSTLYCSSEIKIDHNHLSFSELDHPSKPWKEEFQIHGTCNGIFCIPDISNKDVFLYNPLTNSHRKLPSLQKSFPHSNNMVYGFGYDCLNDDYKVLRIDRGLSLHWFDCSEVKADIYSLNQNSWKCIQGIPGYPYYDRHDNNVVLNGMLHYLVIDMLKIMVIFYFNFQTECLSDVKLPDYYDYKIGNGAIFSLAELSGCLGLLVVFLRDPNKHVDLWVMKEYGNKESWVMLFSIWELEIIDAAIRPLVYMKDGTRILLELNDGDYCWYDLESKHVEKITTYGLPKPEVGLRVSNCGLPHKRGTIILNGSLVSLED